MKNFSTGFKFFNIVLACLQNMTMGGILFGWTSISGGLLISSESNGGPGLTPSNVHMIYVVATFFSFLGPLLLGLVLDKFGPRYCSLLSIALIAIGCILFGISDRENLTLFVPALCLIALGGPGAQSSIIHLSNLFPDWKSTATAFITGSFQLSFIVFLVFDQLWLIAKCSYRTLFIGYSVVCAINAVISIFLWPDTPYSYEEYASIAHEDVEDESEDSEDHHELISAIRLPSVFIHHSEIEDLTKSKIQPNLKNIQSNRSQKKKEFDLKDATLIEQIKSPEFVRLTIFFLVTSFWVNFYIGSFDLQMSNSAMFSTSEIQDYARLFTLIITCGVVGIPLVGASMDTLGFPLTSSIISILGFFWSILLYFQSKETLIASFVFYAMFRTFLFTFVFAYLPDVLGFKYFGVLAGIMFVLGGVLSFLQFPLAELVQGTCMTLSQLSTCDHGYWGNLNLFMAFSLLSTIYFSYSDWQARKEKEIRIASSLLNFKTQELPSIQSKPFTQKSGYGSV